MKIKPVLIAIVTVIFLAPNTLNTYDQHTKTPVYSYSIINTYPHDPYAFTQGLIYHKGVLYESTGLRGRSSLRKVDLKTGNVLQIHRLDRRYFGEGIALWQNKMIQLTWRSQMGFVYNRQTFEKLGHFAYSTEGWGITHDGEKLIMSDGTDTLSFLNPETFEKIGQIQVRDQNKPVVKLNELEYVNGEIFANVLMSHYIARISPKTGQVLGWINLTGLVDEIKLAGYSRKAAVLNGIAYDETGKRLFVTGKLWPKLFEIQLVKP
jgi:glutamine cyclotransferase